jgi:hypothetical protein
MKKETTYIYNYTRTRLLLHILFLNNKEMPLIVKLIFDNKDSLSSFAYFLHNSYCIIITYFRGKETDIFATGLKI